MVEIGENLPDMQFVDTELKQMSLSALRGKPALIAFYPGAFTSVCTKEMCSFRDSMSKLSALNANIVGISVDSPFANKAFKLQNNIQFPLLSDYDRSGVRSFDVELNNFAGLEGLSAAKRSVFITDKNGVVRFKWVSDDPSKEPDYAVLMSELEKAATS